MKDKKKIGLVLGSGSARGLAHIGVLSVFEKYGIRPYCIAGTSIGAAIGALYCSGMSPEQMRRMAITTEWQDLLDFTVPKTGFLAGNKFEKYIQELTGNCRFSDLKIPLRVVATDIKNSNIVVFSAGNVAKAVRASVSIPGVFSPVKIDKHELVDGALVDPLPIGVARDMGAEIIVAVDVSIDLDKIKIEGSKVKERSAFTEYTKSKFFRSQIGFFREFIMETRRFRLPHFMKKYIIKIVDRFLNPKRVYRFFTNKKPPHIIEVAVKSMFIMLNQIYKEKLKNSAVDVIIKPRLEQSIILDFEKASFLIDKGSQATEEVMPKILELLGRDKV